MTDARNVWFAHVYTACVPERLLLRLEHARKRVPASPLEIHYRPILFQPYLTLRTRLHQAVLPTTGEPLS